MTVCLYALIEQRHGHQNFGLPIYIGIGTAKRPRSHIKQARSPSGCRNGLLNLTIRQHLDAGIEPVVEILAVFATRPEADEAERAAIKQYGRLGRDPGGILCNVAHGGDGPDSTIMNDPEVLQHLSEASKRRWATPGFREAQIARFKEVAASDEWHAKVSKRTKDAINEPEARAKHVAALRRISASITKEQKSAWGKSVTDEVKAKRIAALERARHDPISQARKSAGNSIAMKASWADPEARAKRKAGLKGVKKTRTAASDAARAYAVQCMNTPESNAKKGAASKSCWADPEFRAKQKASRAAAWLDPVKRDNVLAGRARARAAKLAASGTRVETDSGH